MVKTVLRSVLTATFKYALCMRVCSVAALCDPPGSSVRGVSQARILEWVAVPPPGALPDSGVERTSPAWQGDSVPLRHQGSPGSSLLLRSSAYHVLVWVQGKETLLLRVVMCFSVISLGTWFFSR